MEDANESNDDLKIIKASAALLSEFEEVLPKVLWKRSECNTRATVHTSWTHRDIEYVIKLIEPFQCEPNLLDSKLKAILPPIVDSFLSYLRHGSSLRASQHVDFKDAVCSILYTLCKVRGSKVIMGFFNNEPRYLELVLAATEGTTFENGTDEARWRVPYILLLWLSHLLLAPFDLATLSTEIDVVSQRDELQLPTGMPAVATRVLNVALKYLSDPTKAQEAAAANLVRLVNRPDMQKLRLAEILVDKFLLVLEESSILTKTVYEVLGPLRFLSGIVTSSELAYLIPDIFDATWKLTSRSPKSSAITSNAVAKKLIVKTMRNSTITCLRCASMSSRLSDFLQTTSILENVIDYLLQSLGDRDTPVRHAAAKALSQIVFELDGDMAVEVIQALLDIFGEDSPKGARKLDFTTANPLKWHGLTLCLGHILFRRSTSSDQLPQILTALLSALNFEQRSSTGSSIGTNVRDAANFGIWSIARRCTTNELLSIHMPGSAFADDSTNVIRHIATQLILSACLDPVGNIRRGSSAALQELIGRHPNQVYEGIPLVQIVDYQAVGLRNRAMVDVACRAANLHTMYWRALQAALLEWRGLGSPDAPSRDHAATSIATLAFNDNYRKHAEVIDDLLTRLFRLDGDQTELKHGIVLSLAYLLDRVITDSLHEHNATGAATLLSRLWGRLNVITLARQDFSSRLVRSNLPCGIARLATAMCEVYLADWPPECEHLSDEVSRALNGIVEVLMERHEDPILETLPALVKSVLRLKRKLGVHIGCLDYESLCSKVKVDSSKSTLHGAGRAISLGSLASLYGNGIDGAPAYEAVTTLSSTLTAANVEWRIIGVRGLHLSLKSAVNTMSDEAILENVVGALHTGLNDYTIDDRGDIGSLVRLEAVSCTETLLLQPRNRQDQKTEQPLISDLLRLSLEKLNRVRLRAALVLSCTGLVSARAYDPASVSSYEYFYGILGLVRDRAEEWKLRAVIEGCISSGGAGAEEILQACRKALFNTLSVMDEGTLSSVMKLYADIMLSHVSETTAPNMTPALELLGFLLDMQIPQRLADNSQFKWRNLLSRVQKAHHKSNDIGKLLAAVHVYLGLAEVKCIKGEVVKKLVSMVKTNPYPRVRIAVAEVLWVVTGDGEIRTLDWTKPACQNHEAIAVLHKRHVGG